MIFPPLDRKGDAEISSDLRFLNAMAFTNVERMHLITTNYNLFRSLPLAALPRSFAPLCLPIHPLSLRLVPAGRCRDKCVKPELKQPELKPAQQAD